MRFIVTLMVASFAMMGSAFADPFANFYGNTVKVDGANARSVMIDEGGAYSQKLADGSMLSGTWTIEGDTACFSSGAAPYCVPAAERAVGDSWELMAPDGSKEMATLVAGR